MMADPKASTASSSTAQQQQAYTNLMQQQASEKIAMAGLGLDKQKLQLAMSAEKTRQLEKQQEMELQKAQMEQQGQQFTQAQGQQQQQFDANMAAEQDNRKQDAQLFLQRLEHEEGLADRNLQARAEEIRSGRLFEVDMMEAETVIAGERANRALQNERAAAQAADAAQGVHTAKNGLIERYAERLEEAGFAGEMIGQAAAGSLMSMAEDGSLREAFVDFAQGVAKVSERGMRFDLADAAIRTGLFTMGGEDGTDLVGVNIDRDAAAMLDPTIYEKEYKDRKSWVANTGHGLGRFFLGEGTKSRQMRAIGTTSILMSRTLAAMSDGVDEETLDDVEVGLEMLINISTGDVQPDDLKAWVSDTPEAAPYVGAMLEAYEENLRGLLTDKTGRAPQEEAAIGDRPESEDAYRNGIRDSLKLASELRGFASDVGILTPSGAKRQLEEQVTALRQANPGMTLDAGMLERLPEELRPYVLERWTAIENVQQIEDESVEAMVRARQEQAARLRESIGG